MDIATIVAKKYLASEGIRRRGWTFFRKALIKFQNDPTCLLLIHDRCLKIPLSHSLPEYLMRFRFYDRLPRRISEYIHQHHGHINCIDVGANIGDSIAAFYKDDQDTFLAVEPNPKFGKLLANNWAWNKNVTIVSDICSSGSDEGNFLFQEENGTASIIQSEYGIKMSRKSVDELINLYPPGGSINVLKTDTDGHDFEVLAGSKRLLSENLPVVLFECGAFNNNNYVEECLKTLGLLKRCGYNYFFVYDNFGHFMGRHSLSDLTSFQYLLFFDIISPFYYFDILLIRDEEILSFYKSEIDYFLNHLNDKSLVQAATAAAPI